MENCHKLLEKFHYSWEMMPLVLVILNYAGSDLDEASRKIDEGESVFRLIKVLLPLLCSAYRIYSYLHCEFFKLYKAQCTVISMIITHYN